VGAPAPRAQYDDFFLALFFLAIFAATGDRWRSGDGAAELAGQWQQHPARTSAFTALVAPLVFGFRAPPMRH
jgi:hypothetical protein